MKVAVIHVVIHMVIQSLIFGAAMEDITKYPDSKKYFGVFDSVMRSCLLTDPLGLSVKLQLCVIVRHKQAFLNTD